MGRRAQQKSVYKTRAKGRKTHANKDFGLYKALKCFLSTPRANIDGEFKQALETSTALEQGIPRSPCSYAQERIPAAFMTARQRRSSPPEEPHVPAAVYVTFYHRHHIPRPRPPLPHVPAAPRPPRHRGRSGQVLRASAPAGPRTAGSSGGAAAAGRRYRGEPRARGRPRPPRLTQPLSAPGPAEAPRPRRGTLTVKGWS